MNTVLTFASGFRLCELANRLLNHDHVPFGASVCAPNCWPIGSAMIEFCTVMSLMGNVCQLPVAASMLFHLANWMDTCSGITPFAWKKLNPFSDDPEAEPGRKRRCGQIILFWLPKETSARGIQIPTPE